MFVSPFLIIHTDEAVLGGIALILFVVVAAVVSC